MLAVAPVRGIFCLGLVAIAAGLGLPSAATAQGPAGTVKFAPHVAIYDLKLTSSRGKRLLEGARGRIVYDFSGSACEGYALQFRQVTELDNGEGKVSLSDLRTTTWEQADGKSFRFKSQNFMDSKQLTEVDGRADRARDKRRGEAVEARRQEVRRRHGGVSDRPHAVADRGGARRQEPARDRGL